MSAHSRTPKTAPLTAGLLIVCLATLFQATGCGTSAPRAASTREPPELGSGDTILVLAAGSGLDAGSARDEALRAAVAQAIGALVVSDETVSDTTLVESRTLAYSDGFVEKVDTVSQETDAAGMVRIKVRALVRRGKLTHAMARLREPSGSADLQSLRAQTATSAMQDRSGVQAIEIAFKDFPARVLTAEPLEPVAISSEGGRTIFEVPVRVSVNPERWLAWTEELDRLLTPVAERRIERRVDPSDEGVPTLAQLVDDRPNVLWSARRERLWQAGRRDLFGSSGQPLSTEPFWIRRFIPGDVWAKAHVYPDFTQAGLARRSVGVLTGYPGTLRAWQVSPAAWQRVVQLSGRAPWLQVRVAGNATKAERNWNERIPLKVPGEKEPTVTLQGLGESCLLLSNDKLRVDFSAMLPAIQKVGEWEDPLEDPDGSRGIPRLMGPSAIMVFKTTLDRLVITSPACTLPFRFSAANGLMDAVSAAPIEVRFLSDSEVPLKSRPESPAKSTAGSRNVRPLSTR